MRFLLAVILLALFVPSASAHPTLPDYDVATKCKKRNNPGIVAMTAWRMTKAGAKGITSFWTDH
jgi:hypothetical protein